MHALLKPTKLGFLDHIEEHKKLNQRFFIDPEIGQSLKRKILYSHRNNFDWENGGTKTPIKFLDRDSVEYSLYLASQGDKTEENMAKLTLNNALTLIDPVWGGVYQYSTKDWQSPHHSKTMSNQAGYLRIYALAYALWKSENYLNAALSIRDYLKNFLLADTGSFYSGQSDQLENIRPNEYFSFNDQQRRTYGIPAIKKLRCSRENGCTHVVFHDFNSDAHERHICTPCRDADYDDDGFKRGAAL